MTFRVSFEQAALKFSQNYFIFSAKCNVNLSLVIIKQCAISPLDHLPQAQAMVSM